MTDQTVRNAIILGSGPAGYTAALYLGRANLKPLILAGSMVGGQLTTTTIVENFPGFPEGRDGNQLMTDMERQCVHYGAEIEYELAEGIVREGEVYVISTTKGPMKAHTVLVCTGASPRLLDIVGEKTFWNYGVHTCAVCDGGFYRGKEVIVVGGGDSAMEEASYLAKLCAKVTIVHRRDALRASKIMADRVTANPKIEFAWNSVVKEVKGTVEGPTKKKTASAVLASTVGGPDREIPVSAVFIAVGHTPNSGFLKGTIDLDENGYVKVNSRQETNLPGVFAAGDIHDHHYRQAITAAGFGCMAALEAERYLTRLGITA